MLIFLHKYILVEGAGGGGVSLKGCFGGYEDNCIFPPPNALWGKCEQHKKCNLATTKYKRLNVVKK